MTVEQPFYLLTLDEIRRGSAEQIRPHRTMVMVRVDGSCHLIELAWSGRDEIWARLVPLVQVDDRLISVHLVHPDDPTKPLMIQTVPRLGTLQPVQDEPDRFEGDDLYQEDL